MLQTLKIENVALIDKVTINFDEKLNVISGETGAGKSILLDSLSFVFGGRADKTLIRTGSTSMKVEAVFSNLLARNIELIKTEIGVDCTDELFLSRELDVNGKNTCKINGELVPVASVKKICQLLVDIHGQSEHLAILNNDYQLKIVDMFGGIENELLILNNFIEEYKLNEKNIADLGGNEQEKQNLIDLYKYQINEIETVNILPTELEDLQAEKKEMQQFEKINENLSNCCENIERNENGNNLLSGLADCVKSLKNIADLNSKYLDLQNRLNSCLVEVEDINETIKSILDENNFDEERFNFVDERIDLINNMFRKYGGNYNCLVEYYNAINKKLENLLNSAEKYQELQQKKSKIKEKIINQQEIITKLREKSAIVLQENLQKELKTLGMPNCRITIDFQNIEEEFSVFGAERVDFMFSSNLGFELKPLNKVVSGGEMSRVMLAYKIVVSGVDNIHTIIFDEIDSGLSGNTASVVAEYMARLSLNKQIVAISHLPQICAMADKNIKVEKFSDSLTTHTNATVLNDEKLLGEIARLMGVECNDKGLSVAQDLKNKSNNYKVALK